MKMVENEKDIIEEYKQYYQSIFIDDIDDLCQKFNIDIPDDIR